MRKYWILSLLLIGCERPFVETSQPDLNVIQPDMTQVQTSRVITIEVQSSHFRALEELLLNGAPMTLVPSGRGYWEISVGLRLGMNIFYLDATDFEGVTNRDTIYTVYLPHNISLNAPSLPDGRGGHTLVRLNNGSLMVSGGARQRGGRARKESFILTPNSRAFAEMDVYLREPRTGHTANLLPDDRILIVGGSQVDGPSNVNDLIETVEIFDPNGDTPKFVNLPVRGQPIRRAYHTSTIRASSDQLILDLIGGLGDIRYGENPVLGTRQDIRSFRIESTQLVAIHSLASAPLIFEPVSGHTVTQTRSNSYILLGSQFFSGIHINANMNITYSETLGLRFAPLPQLATPRTAHSTTRLLREFAATFGGLGIASDIVSHVDIYHEPTNQFFTLNPSSPMVPRHGHSAISTGSRSALLVGGFGPNGTATTASEYLFISSE